jgi:hypothetical protein
MSEDFVIEHSMVDLDPSRQQQQSETKPTVVPSKPSHRVFRVTTLQGGDYESIPLQRLQNSFGSKGFGRSAVGILGVFVIVSVVLFLMYMHALEGLHDAQQSEYIINIGIFVLHTRTLFVWFSCRRYRPARYFSK